MAREFKILQSEFRDWLFLDKHAVTNQYVSYRYFIENCLKCFLKKHSIAEGHLEFKNFLAVYNGQRIYPNNNQNDSLPFQLYWVKDTDSCCVLIDYTKWCFPLIIDSQERVNGLSAALENINDQFNNISKILYDYREMEWDQNLQNEMDKFDSRNRK